MKAKLFLCLITAALIVYGCGQKTKAPVPKQSTEVTSEASNSEKSDDGDEAVKKTVTPSPEDARKASEASSPTPSADAKEKASDTKEDQKKAEDPDAPSSEEDDLPEDDYVTPEDPAYLEGPEDGTGAGLVIEDAKDAVNDDLPDYLKGNAVKIPADGSEGVGEGAAAEPGSVFILPEQTEVLTYPSKEVAFTRKDGDYTVTVTDVKRAKTRDGAPCLAFTFSFTNVSLTSPLFIDTLSLAVTDQDGLILDMVTENNPSLAALESAEAGQTRSFDIKYYLTDETEKAAIYYTDMTADTKAVGWVIDLADLA